VHRRATQPDAADANGLPTPAGSSLVMITSADWSAPGNEVCPAPTSAGSTPVANATLALDHYFAQLPSDTAAEPSFTSDTAKVNADADDATDRFY
jgi:hypothetical protein